MISTVGSGFNPSQTAFARKVNVVCYSLSGSITRVQKRRKHIVNVNGVSRSTRGRK
jgi:hypothetical protein